MLVAYGSEHLREIINANDKCRDFSVEEVDRITSLTRERTQRRIDGPMDDEPNDLVVTSDWYNFAQDNWGKQGSIVNQVMLGTPNEKLSDGRDAMVFEEAAVVQNQWLKKGDGRYNRTEEYVDEDYDDATPGTFWLPNAASEYVTVVRLDDEMVRDQAKLTDAM